MLQFWLGSLAIQGCHSDCALTAWRGANGTTGGPWDFLDRAFASGRGDTSSCEGSSVSQFGCSGSSFIISCRWIRWTSSTSDFCCWSKLVNKPPVFDFPNQEQDQRHFRDWLWQLNQYLICVDEGFSKELSQITEKPLDLDTAPLEVRQRSAKLHGLVAGLVKNRALSIVRAAPAGNGFETLRQLVLSMRPNTQARGLSLLASVTAWPAFSMGRPLQAQLLKLEDAYDETRRAGTTLGDELKCAILLRCLSGALKTHLSLSLKENSTYSELREEILRWDRAHQKWSNLVSATDDTSDVKPMEIDRIQGKGKTGDKGKGKSDKGGQKGKSKQKGKDKGKSKNSNDKSGYSGKGKSTQNPGKGKGKGDRICYVCGKPGHLAKECWSNVRNAQASSSVGGSGQSEWTSLTSVSQQ